MSRNLTLREQIIARRPYPHDAHKSFRASTKASISLNIAEVHPLRLQLEVLKAANSSTQVLVCVEHPNVDHMKCIDKCWDVFDTLAQQICGEYPHFLCAMGRPGKTIFILHLYPCEEWPPDPQSDTKIRALLAKTKIK